MPVHRSHQRRAAAFAAAGFRPCIDIHKGKVKQIVGSTLEDLGEKAREGAAAGLVTNFESDLPSAFYAHLYRHSGLPGGHVVMLGDDQASRAAAFEALMAFPGGLQLGGGVTADNAALYLGAGASHVIVTSWVFREGRLDRARLAELVEVVGRERLVLDLSCRKKDDGRYYVVTDRWQRFSELAVDDSTLADLGSSCAEFLVHGVDVEGKQLGVDEALVRLLGAASPLPVTYAGGVRTLGNMNSELDAGKGRISITVYSARHTFTTVCCWDARQEDMELVQDAGGGRVGITVGSALDIFGGGLAFDAVLAWHRRLQAAAA